MRTAPERAPGAHPSGPPASPESALIVGAGYIALEMAEGLRVRGLDVTQVEALPEVLPTVEEHLGALVHAELDAHGVEVVTSTTVERVGRGDNGNARLHVTGHHGDGGPSRRRPRRRGGRRDRSQGRPRRRRAHAHQPHAHLRRR